MSAGLFLAEGPQAVSEALAVPGCVVEVFATAAATERYGDLQASAVTASVAWRQADEAAIQSLTDTVTPQGVVAVCHTLDVPLSSVLEQQPTLVAICADVRNPGNAGAVIRCADAAGADAVVLAGSSVDPYNGKAVRASVGSLFHLPIVSAVSVEDAVQGLRAAGLVVLAADGGGTDLDLLVDAGELARPTAWLFGNEAWGLPAADAALADRVVAVPIYGRAESLNLATAAAVCLYASARDQRRSRR
jgi:TrmH family RNA methyltransferase